MDILSDVLRALQLRGAIFLDARFTAPWCAISKTGHRDTGFFADAEHIVFFHILMEGNCSARLLFVEAVRRYADSASAEDTGWFAGLRDRVVGKALALMHAHPERPWSIDELGAQVGMSRSALAQRFTDLVGRPPMQYLTRWRLTVAAQRLRRDPISLNRIAEHVGYESQAAFNRAFKREFGVTPARWRREGHLG